MSAHATIVELPDRAVIRVTGPDAAALLDNVVTNDVEKLTTAGDALHAGLLTPQGKILAEFFVARTADGFLIETARSEAEALVKRLGMYRLRMKVTFADETEGHDVFAVLDGERPPCEGVAFADPRSRAMGWRIIVPAGTGVVGDAAPERAYHDRRVTAGVAESGPDFSVGDAFPHDVDWDQTGSVDFKKGCFVGQEVVSRMQHKALVRKRVVRIDAAAGGLESGAAVRIGEAEIGRVGTVASDGSSALALVRLDRVAEALTTGGTLHAGAVEIIVDGAAVAAYRAAAQARSGS